MKIVSQPITLTDLSTMAKNKFGNLVKVVVDIEKELMVIDAELHSDEEALLLEKGSKQENLWGINIYPQEKGVNFIEFDSMINVRPSIGNLNRGIENKKIREKIIKIVEKLIQI